MDQRYTQIVDIMQRGGIAVIPTDTLYGIVASAMQSDAVERVYTLRGRDRDKPCIVLIAQPRDIFGFDVAVSPREFHTISKLWASSTPTSIIVPLRSRARDKWSHLHRGRGTIAFRVPTRRNERGRHLRKLLTKTGPLVAPSANPQGRAPAQTAHEARSYFMDTVDYYVSCGRRLCSAPSRLATFDKEVIQYRPRT